MIITGENVFPIEVEQALVELPSVVHAAAFGVPDEYWGERIEAAVMVEQGATLAGDDLRGAVRDRLAGYKFPSASTSRTHCRSPPTTSSTAAHCVPATMRSSSRRGHPGDSARRTEPASALLLVAGRQRLGVLQDQRRVPDGQ